jgi:opacity protein-like surface antigen
MAVSIGSSKVRRLAILAAGACMAGQAGAAMPGLYFAGFYMDSTLAYSSVDAEVAGFDAGAQGIWESIGGVVQTWDGNISDTKDIGYGFAVGYQFSQYLAGELSYLDMGTVHYEAQGTVSDGGSVYNSQTFLSAKTKGPLITAVGIWPMGDRISLDARAGMFFGRTRLRGSLFLESSYFADVSDKDNKNSVMLGAGVNWAMSPGMAIRAGYTRLADAMVSEYDVSSWTLSLKYAW